MTDWNEHEDAISDAISDSIDMDWTSRTGAKAVVAWLNENAAAPAAPQAAGVGELGDAVDRLDCAANFLEGDCVIVGDHEVRGNDLLTVLSALRAPSREPEGGAVDADAILEMAAKAVEDHQKAGREWVKGSLWDDLTREASGRIRALKSALATREEAPDWTARTEAAWTENNSEEAPAGSGIAYMAGLLAKAAVEASEEAPAEAGERDYPAEFEAWWSSYRHRNRDVADYPVKKQIAFDAFYFGARAQPQAREDAQPVAVCDGVEQPAFEEWASKQGLDMHEHPLHYLFLDAKTDAARQAWKAGLEHAVGRMATHPAPDAQPVGWLRAADEEMVCAHLGVAEAEDSYETAKKKLASLIQWNIAVAMDPSVGGRPAPDALRVAVEALEPFSAEADNWAESVPDTHRSLCTEPGSTTALPGSETAFTVGDLRRAASALAALQAEQGAK